MEKHTFGAPMSTRKLGRQLLMDVVDLIKCRMIIQSAKLRASAIRHKVRSRVPVKASKKFVITLVDMPLSVQSAQRCISTARKHGEGDDIEIVPAVDKFHSEEFFRVHGLSWDMDYCEETDAYAGMGCFASHYKLWSYCVDIGKPITVLEHDAEFVSPIPPLRMKDVIVLANNMSTWYTLPSHSARESFYPTRNLYGTHAYMVTPEGAHKLITQAHRKILPPVDCFMRKNFIEIILCNPTPLKLNHQFSSIAQWNKRMPGLA